MIIRGPKNPVKSPEAVAADSIPQAQRLAN
jgi:hypothetical protein